MAAQNVYTDNLEFTKLRCEDLSIHNERANYDNQVTDTITEQKQVERDIENLFIYAKNLREVDSNYPLLLRDKHVSFLRRGLNSIPQSYQCLDASRPWLCYWILHSLEILDQQVNEELKTSLVNFLGTCQCKDGGFGGGPFQVAHLAPTYAAVNALCIIGTEEAYSILDRENLLQFLWRVKQDDGSFCMHEGGEADLRAVYCALSVASLSNISSSALFEGTADWIKSCQTYEGGFGGVPGLEAHGGYSFCGFASLVILGKEMKIDIDKLLRWLVNRQMRYEGGFQGRTNKLVDGCYSFWQGGAFPLVHRFLSTEQNNWLYNQKALQEYLLICCQNTSGGLIDKPGKFRDYYHTCYVLSGLSVSQHFMIGQTHLTSLIGHRRNEVCPTHPIFNIGIEAAINAIQYFSSLPNPNIDGRTKN